MDVRIWRVGTGIGERGPVEKGRESRTRIPALQLHVFMEGKAGRSGGGLRSLAMRAAAAAWWVGRWPWEWEPPWGNLPEAAKEEVSSELESPKEWVSPASFREGYYVKPFQADLNFGETPSCKFTSDLFKGIRCHDSPGCRLSQCLLSRSCVSKRCSFGVRIYYLTRSSQTLYGKFYYYSPFIGH